MSTGLARRPTEQPGTTTLRMPRIDRRTAVITLVLLLLPALIAATVALRQPTLYEAQADILYSPPRAANASNVQAVMNTQISRVSSGEVLSAVTEDPAQRLEVSSHISAEQVGDGYVMRIRVRDPDGDRARETAGTVANTYVKLINGEATLGDQQAKMEADLKAVRDREQQVTAELADTTNEQRRSQLASELSSLRQQSLALDASLTELTVQGLTNSASAQVITQPFVSPDPVQPAPVPALAAGLLAGVLLVVGYLAARRYRLVK